MELCSRFKIALAGMARGVALLLLVAMFPAAAQAQLTNIQYLTSTSNGQITITGFFASGSGPLVIPSTINGLPVVSIGAYAFEYAVGLTTVTIPDGVTSIGAGAFLERSLSSVTIPGSVTSIGNVAFAGCTNLTSVAIPNGVTSIGLSAFLECSSLPSVTIPSSVTSIGPTAFAQCTSLTSAVFLGNAPAVGAAVFNGASTAFTVEYYLGAAGFASPIWTDSAGNTYPAVDLGTLPTEEDTPTMPPWGLVALALLLLATGSRNSLFTNSRSDAGDYRNR